MDTTTVACEKQAAGAPELTPAMIEAGIKELHRVIPMDVASPVLDDYSVVERVLSAALKARILL